MQQESGQSKSVRTLTSQEVLSFASPTKLRQALEVIGGFAGSGKVGKFPRTGVELVRSDGQWTLEGDEVSIKRTQRHLEALRAGKRLHGSEPLMEFKFN
jgi:hypothetical protein